MAQTGEQTLHCSFCGKPEREVAKIIAGPGVYICDVCVALCQDILAGASRSAQAAAGDEPLAADEGGAPRLRVWDDLGEDELLALLPRMSTASGQVESGLHECVARLRDLGVTWSRIGEALGITRQSAWGRFSGED
ncbi:ClpX C4-type zinc finger protein [Georgenia sp. SUBG003]|uniref:ClpX C4-type zinc finger protein n=1 Tax=Georgenia sp. SUBG003 TaxID=1497974 RepID=UPI0004D87C11|nr:hypothetical protein DA06_10730 [Georgenia sp. SUBG003]